MRKMKQSALGVMALLPLLLSLSSCGAENQPAQTGDTKTESATTTSPNQAETDLVVFRNENGDIVCPVMGTVIPSTDKAAGGSRDYKGKRYYFCCAECAPKFDQNPDAYAEGKHLKEKSQGTTPGEHSEEAHEH